MAALGCLVLAGMFLVGPVRDARAGPQGPVLVVDADTIIVGGVTVRIHGIDAPETAQTCERPGGAVWSCGEWATAMVRAQFEGRLASCDAIQQDRYGRTVGRCLVTGADIGRVIVENGWATAYRRYSHDYVGAESAAISAGRGIFGGSMVAPERFRRAGTTAAAVQVVAVPGNCDIKGNVSKSGHIYHLPGQRFYSDTSIREDKGERWFCSEAEAVAAGWRRAER